MVKYADNRDKMNFVDEKENFEKSGKEAVSANSEKVVDVGESKVEATAAEVSAEAMKTIDSAESAEGDEGFSEKKGDKKDFSGSAKKDDTTVADLKAHIQKTVPTTKMRKEIAAEIRKEIRKEEQKVLLAYVGLKKYPPSRLAEKVAKIRSLRDLLSSLVDATKEFLTGLYLKWVRHES